MPEQPAPHWPTLFEFLSAGSLALIVYAALALGLPVPPEWRGPLLLAAFAYGFIRRGPWILLLAFPLFALLAWSERGDPPASRPGRHRRWQRWYGRQVVPYLDYVRTEASALFGRLWRSSEPTDHAVRVGLVAIAYAKLGTAPALAIALLWLYLLACHALLSPLPPPPPDERRLRSFGMLTGLWVTAVGFIQLTLVTGSRGPAPLAAPIVVTGLATALRLLTRHRRHRRFRRFLAWCQVGALLPLAVMPPVTLAALSGVGSAP